MHGTAPFRNMISNVEEPFAVNGTFPTVDPSLPVISIETSGPTRLMTAKRGRRFTGIRHPKTVQSVPCVDFTCGSPPCPDMHAAAPLAHLSSGDRTLFYQYGLGSSRHVQIPIIHHSFEKHARTQPQAIAVEHLAANESITYSELDLCSDRLAHTLRTRGIVPGKRICILARRSVALAVAILAVLKAGAQYVPLDALTITDETLQFVIGDASPSIVLVMDEFKHRVFGVPVISLEPTILSEAQSNPNPSKVEDLSSPTDGAYCIYTSGTTGMNEYPYYCYQC